MKTILFLVSAAMVHAAILPAVPYNILFGTSGSCITASSNTDGATVTIETCTNNVSTQQWVFASGAPFAGSGPTGTISIFGNKCLDVTNGVNTPGTKLQIWTCTPGDTNQLWTVTSNPTSSTIGWAGTDKVVDLTNGVLTNGNQIQIWTSVGNANQQWTPQSAGITLPPGTPLQLTAHESNPIALGPCITTQNQFNGSPVFISPCTSSNVHTNTWTLTPSHTGTFSIFGDTFCLDVTNGVNADGTHLQIWECVEGNTNQQWVLDSDGAIVWKGTNKCVDLTNGNMTAGNPIQIWTCFEGNTNQLWKQIPQFVQ